MGIEYLNPVETHLNPAYSQGVSVPAAARYVYIGGQNAVDKEGRIVGEGDLAAQTLQALANLSAVLVAGRAKPEHLISVSVYSVGDADIRLAFGAWATFWGDRGPPPVIKVLRVTGLANPAFLIEIEAIAAVVDGGA